MHHTWTVRRRPDRLERRYEFADYASTRDFLDRVAEVCEQAGQYPDISFGRTYVNATLPLAAGEATAEASGDPEAHRLAAALDALVPADPLTAETSS